MIYLTVISSQFYNGNLNSLILLNTASVHYLTQFLSCLCFTLSIFRLFLLVLAISLVLLKIGHFMYIPHIPYIHYPVFSYWTSRVFFFFWYSLSAVNRVAINRDVEVFLCWIECFGSISSNGVAGLYGSSVSSLLRNLLHYF